MTMRRAISFTLLVLIVLSNNSCVKNNPAPAWIEVSTWELEENPFSATSAGELTHAFTSAWVYVDGKFIGIFEAPFKIPILEEGWKKITLYPTVLNNGISATKKIYPFVEAYEIEAELIKNQVTSIHPVTRYKSNTILTILDFNGANIDLDDDPDSPASILNSSDPDIIESFNGGQFGKVELTSTENIWISATPIGQNLPQGAAEVYMEMDIYCTEDVVTGILALNGAGVTQNRNVQINEQKPEEATWRKLYIDLTTIVSGSQQGSDFKHSFEAFLDEGKTEAVICIDNIKIVRF